jgi:ribulose 1,5-bisphosphate carboxylase large subunit-like protein
VHLIKDDEKMNNVEYCQLAKRTKLVHQRLNQVKEATGMKPLYVTNITTRPDKILDNARIARDNGAEGLMLNMFASGLDSITILRKAPDLNLPIYIHSGTTAAMSRAEGQGIELNVFAKFARYLGGDFFRTGVHGGYCVGTQEQFDTANHGLQEPILGIKESIPALSGGLRAGHMPMNIKNAGLNVVYMAGSSYAGHPMGTKAGVKAFVQAADAYRLGIRIEKYAETHSELKVAIDKWGYSNIEKS